jgi:hypothetical protein
MNEPTPPHRWVTFYRIHTPDGQLLLVQKRDGSSRTVVVPVRPRMATMSHSYPGSD